MVTPEKLRIDMAKLDALMEAFEHTYLHFIDLGEGEEAERDKGTMAFYAMRDLLQKVIVEADELSGHMEVCDAVFAVNRIGRKESLK